MWTVLLSLFLSHDPDNLEEYFVKCILVRVCLIGFRLWSPFWWEYHRSDTASFFMQGIRRHVILVCSNIGDVNFEWLFEILTYILWCEATLYFSRLLGHTNWRWLCIHYSSSASHPRSGFILSSFFLSTYAERQIPGNWITSASE